MVADLVELTRQAFEHEKARWDSVKDTHISGRNRHAVWRAMEETKFEYAKSMLDKALEEGVLEFFGKARGKEVYTNRKMINAFTQEGTGKSQMREYQPGSLFFIVEKFHTDPVHDKYTIVYTDGALKPEDHKIWSLIPWKKQRKRVLHTVTHNVDGINRQDAAYGNLMFLFGAMHLLYSYGRDLLNPPKTSADFYAGMLLYGLDAVLAIGGFALIARAHPRPMFKVEHGKQDSKVVKINKFQDDNALYILDSALTGYNGKASG